ncbi:hypothetical protein B4Q13_18110 [Lacticaseibacillus rhamnosus]
MSGVFFMLTLGAYLHYTRKSSVARYVTLSILFAAAMSKARTAARPTTGWGAARRSAPPGRGGGGRPLGQDREQVPGAAAADRHRAHVR